MFEKYLNSLFLFTFLAATGLLVLPASEAMAFQKVVPFNIDDPRSFVRDSVRIGPDDKVGVLAPSQLEIINKDNLIDLKLKDPKKFDQIRAAGLENSVLYQSWIDEVRDALANPSGVKAVPADRRWPSNVKSTNKTENYRRFFMGTPIDVAKRIALKEMYLALEHNWPWLKNTVFNDYGVETWKSKPVIHSPEAPLQTEEPGGSDLAVEKIKELFHFSPKLSSDKFYVFSFEFGGPNFVEINKNTLKVGRVGLDIDSGHDVNRLEKGADKITAEESDDSDTPPSSHHKDHVTDSAPAANTYPNMNNYNNYGQPPPTPQQFAPPPDGANDIMY